MGVRPRSQAVWNVIFGHRHVRFVCSGVAKQSSSCELSISVINGADAVRCLCSENILS